ncbi:hypothetical protein D3C87_1801280 [compost metagenome]
MSFHRFATLGLTQGFAGATHFTTGLAELFARFHAHAFQAVLKFLELVAQTILLSSQLFQRFAQLFRSHPLRG